MLVRTRISPGLHAALQTHLARTGDSVHHAVAAALSAYLERPHHTLFQVSTEGALAHGVSTGCMRLEDVLRHGDLGLGTFDHLDGEGILLDGVCWRAAADGTVARAPPRALTPFWVVTRFKPERAFEMRDVRDLDDLIVRLDQARATPNVFAAARLHGRFGFVSWRIIRPAESRAPAAAGGAPTEASQRGRQPLDTHFTATRVTGSLVGFFTPLWAAKVNTVGWRLHFISEDRLVAGHVHGLGGADVRAELQDFGELHIALPETAEFMRADLAGGSKIDLNAND